MQYVPYPSAQQFTPAGPWVPAGPAEPRSSGYRVASGIVALVLGVWLFTQFLAGASVSGFAPFLVLMAAFGTIASAIVLLAKQRGRLRAAPALLLGWTSFALLVCFIVAIGFGVHRGTLIAPLLAAPVLTVMGIGLSRENRGL
jgi:peptidoglycan/LPS O-acetylase OafA/YrhL